MDDTIVKTLLALLGALSGTYVGYKLSSIQNAEVRKNDTVHRIMSDTVKFLIKMQLHLEEIAYEYKAYKDAEALIDNESIFESATSEANTIGEAEEEINRKVLDHPLWKDWAQKRDKYLSALAFFRFNFEFWNDWYFYESQIKLIKNSPINTCFKKIEETILKSIESSESNKKYSLKNVNKTIEEFRNEYQKMFEIKVRSGFITNLNKLKLYCMKPFK